MASSALEEKINKIRLQNEEIRRRYEEVEADKKNAAKLNALVQLVPSDDWPERKEPPEFSAPPKNLQKQKSVPKDRENERPSQHYPGIQERLAKKEHKFAQGDGPPPDPKYNFLADSERETNAAENSRAEEDKNKSRNKTPRGGAGPRRRGGNNAGSRDAFFKDNRGPHAFHSREESLPEYEAWRAERNRIDEARINRQKTAEGNWRREWDCNKVSLEKDQPRRDFTRKEPNMFDRRNNHYDNDYSNRGHGGSRTYHQSQKNYTQDYRHPHHEQPHEFKRQQPDSKTPLVSVDNRSVAATDQSIKVTVNQGSQANKATVMSVKVNSPSIAGTGRVGPRQKSRITYSSQSDSYPMDIESNSFARQISFDEKTTAANFTNESKIAPKSPFSQRKKEGNPKSPYFSKKEFKNDESFYSKSQSKASNSQRNESRDQRQSNNFVSKAQRIQKRKLEFDKTGNVSVAKDSVPVYSDFTNTQINNEFYNSSNDSIKYETNEIGKEFSDVSNVLDNSADSNNEIIDDTDKNTSFENQENVHDSRFTMQEYSINSENADGIHDQFQDTFENNHKTIEMDNNVKINESTASTGNNKSFDVYSYLVNECTDVKPDDASIDSSKKEQIEAHEEIAKIDDEKVVVTDSKPSTVEPTEVIAEAEVNTQSLVDETKDVAETLNETSSTVEVMKVDVELESTLPLETQANEIEHGIENVEEPQQNTDDSKVEDNSVNEVIEPEENTLADDSLHQVDNDSGFLDNVANDSLNTTNTDVTCDSAIISDSNTVEDLNDSLDKSGTENKNDEITPESTEPEIVDVTKEDDCKKAVEICDNVSATSSDTQLNEGKEKVNEVVENSIEDNDAKVDGNDHQNSEASKVINLEKENVNAEEKKVEKVSEDPVEITPEESKKE